MVHIDIFSGIGGFALAAEWAGYETVCFCECDPYCQQVLRKHWPNVPIVEDIHGFTAKRIRRMGIAAVDLLTGGPPCQPASVAGKRRGKEDDRWLWPETVRVLGELKPRWALFENPTGILSMGFDDLLSDVERQGYEVGAAIVPACAVNAPHRRDRVWIVAYSDAVRCDVWGPDGQGIHGQEQARDEVDSGGQDVSDSARNMLDRTGNPGQAGWREPANGDWWDVEPDVCRVAHGVPRRVDRLRALGNAIVPQVAYQIIRAIKEAS
ncbi:MAG: DNA cytosine methyltransferase [Deltaproteobacteria bacterium]|nr:DNA cytosine methyltransferase [Deltaproteobacteria bacterium]